MDESELPTKLVQLYLTTQSVIALIHKQDFINAEMAAYDLENLASQLKMYAQEKWMD